MSQVLLYSHTRIGFSERNWGLGIGMGILTISDLRTKRDILGGGALNLLLRRHCNQSSNASRLGGGALLKISGKFDPIFKGVWRNPSLESPDARVVKCF